MRFLVRDKDGTVTLTIPIYGKELDLYSYAILSHRWGPPDEEVVFEDIETGSGSNKPGYAKIDFCAKQAENNDLKYFWVDSCAIKKSSDAELSEAINSMYRWYSRAVRCYVFLSDVSAVDKDLMQSFRSSEWFARGWTLQELLAPASVEFFSKEGISLGTRHSLSKEISAITGIALSALEGTPLSQFRIEERFRWAEKRHTTREED